MGAKQLLFRSAAREKVLAGATQLFDAVRAPATFFVIASDLPQAGLDAITLETKEGRRIARARLGQNRGMRALKISLAESPGRNAPPFQVEVPPVAAPPPVQPEELRAAS